MIKAALGRGFEGLVPAGFDIADVATPSEQIKLVEIGKIVANPDQPRKSFDSVALHELAESIKQHGIIQPLVVTPYKDKYRIVAGERRYRASKIAGLKKIPAIIRNHKELEELEIALVENVQRVDLSPLETAVSIVKLKEQFSLSPKEISKKLGKAETTISNIIRLLQLPKEAIEALQKNEISEGHARAILALKDSKEAQIKLLKAIKKDGLTVREAESFVHKQRAANNNIEQNSSTISEKSFIILKTLNNRGLRVKIQPKKRGGTLIFDFKNSEELDQFLEKI